MTTLTSTNPADELLTLDELCTMLKMTKGAVYKQRSRGTGPTGYLIGRELRFKHGDVLAWLESKREAS